jgi:hypothetical protein
VVGLVDAIVNAVSDAANELIEGSIARDGQHIRGCNMNFD